MTEQVFISPPPPGLSNSTIDLTFTTRDFAILCEAVTEPDSYDSEHLPIRILINETAPNSWRFKYKINLNKKQLDTLHCLLERESTRFENAIFSFLIILDSSAK